MRKYLVLLALTGCEADKANLMPTADVAKALYKLFSTYPATGSSEIDTTQCPRGGFVYRVGPSAAVTKTVTLETYKLAIPVPEIPKAVALYDRCADTSGHLTFTGKLTILPDGSFRSDGMGIIGYDSYLVNCNFTISAKSGSICGRYTEVKVE